MGEPIPGPLRIETIHEDFSNYLIKNGVPLTDVVETEAVATRRAEYRRLDDQQIAKQMHDLFEEFKKAERSHDYQRLAELCEDSAIFLLFEAAEQILPPQAQTFKEKFDDTWDYKASNRISTNDREADEVPTIKVLALDVRHELEFRKAHVSESHASDTSMRDFYDRYCAMSTESIFRQACEHFKNRFKNLSTQELHALYLYLLFQHRA